jgi:hypothetical protein
MVGAETGPSSKSLRKPMALGVPERADVFVVSTQSPQV